MDDPLRVFLSEVSPCQDDPVEILPLAMGPLVSELQVFLYIFSYTFLKKV